MSSRRNAALGLLALAASWPSVVTALDPDICATITTNDQNTFTDNLQTNGLCKTHCQGKAAFAITKGYDCWCSNYAPAKAVQVDLSDCNFPCWGYPDEPCGGTNGEYSYVQLEDIAPSGTRGGDKPSSTSSKPSKTQDDPEPSELPSTSDEPVTETEQSESETTSSSSSTRTTSSAKTTSEPTSTAVKTVTADGTIKTVFIAPSEAPTSEGDSNQSEGEHINGGDSGGGGGVSKGALAGIIVGVALGVIALVGVGLWFFFRRRRNQQQEEDYQEDPSIRGSSSGMMGSGNRPEMSMGGGSPGSPNTNSNRNSALMIDPRMDPFKQGLYVRSASHESINTLRDDHDYSRRIQQRTLRAMNPDPEPAG